MKQVNDPLFVFDAFASGPGLVLFLDGLDEVPAEKLKVAEQLISGVIETFRHESSETSIVVTARTQLRSSLTRGFVESFGEVFTVTPFTPADVFAFLRRWDFPPARRLTETQRIFEHLRRNVTLFAMCTNPLVLAMYVAEDELHMKEAGTTARLPDTRVKFYDQVVGELLYFRRVDQRSPKEPIGSQVLITRQELLGRIALDHLMESNDPANAISLTRAARIAQKYWSAANIDEAARDLVKLAVETGLVTVQQEGRSLQFIHLSVCEYLAGKELAERDEEHLSNALEKVAGDTRDARRLWETVIFAVALAKRDPRERALRRLAELKAPGELILRIVREVQSYDLPQFQDAVLNTTASISAQPVHDWDVDWIDSVRLLLSCLTDAHRLASVRHSGGLPTALAWLQTLVGSDSRRFDRVFELYIAASPAEALRVAGELGVRDRLFTDRERIVSAMEHPDLIALGMKMIAESADDMSEWLDVIAEAALRFELVAQTLFEEAAPASLSRLTERVGARHAWHVAGPVAGTFYGAVLAATADRGATDPASIDGRLTMSARVSLVRHVHPSADRVGRTLALTGLAVGVSAIAAFVALRYEDPVLVGLLPFTLLLTLVNMTVLRAGAFRVHVGSRSELLGIVPAAGGDVGSPDICVVRFDDRVVRIYSGHDDAQLLDGIHVAEIRRSLIPWRLAVLDEEGRMIEANEPVRVVSLVEYSSLTQACNVLRRSGPLVYIGFRPRYTVTLFPPRSGRPPLPKADKPRAEGVMADSGRSR